MVSKKIASLESRTDVRLNSLAASVKSFERRQDAESERTNACWVSLEKELSTKITRGDLDALGSRVSKLEQATSPSLAALLASKAGIKDMHCLMNRVGGLESAFGVKAGDQVFERSSLAISDQAVRLEELKDEIYQLKHEASSKTTNECLHTRDREDLSQQMLQGPRMIALKASNENLGTREDLEQQMLQLYPKPEMDALLTRRCWRLNQSGKVLGLSSLSQRIERPLSARR